LRLKLNCFSTSLNATAGRTVKTLTIDRLNINTPISFMKVDIQGSDLFALRGAVETIKRHRMPIIFEFEQQFQAEFRTSFQDYVDFVNSISYRFAKLVMDINYLIVPPIRWRPCGNSHRKLFYPYILWQKHSVHSVIS
jgi:hypothetical protein